VRAEGVVPITYQIDKTPGVIRTTCTGFVTFTEVAELFRQLEQDPDCPRKLDVLLDLRETTSLPTSEQLKAVTEQIGRLREKVQFGAGAFVVGTDAFFGTVMVFEVFAARAFRTTKVFREVAEAESWLEQQRKERF
jgi:hypothetical protein